MKGPGNRELGVTNAAVSPLLEVKNLTVRFRRRSEWLTAVDSVSFSIASGETVALVGESGSGKSTVARAIAGLVAPSGGEIRYRGNQPRRGLGHRRGPLLEVQMVFQDPSGSLDPRMRVGRALEEVLALHGLPREGSRDERVAELLAAVGLDAEVARQRPRSLSGGQRQRVAIARALAVEPRLLLCDEPVSALDVSIRAQVMQVLRQLQKDFELSYLFITHDLALVPQIARRVLVMYGGRIVETTRVDELFARPLHPYTRLLLESIPSLSGRRAIRAGRVSEVEEIPVVGCPFAPRCPYATEESTAVRPALEDLGGHWVACHNWREVEEVGKAPQQFPSVRPG